MTITNSTDLARSRSLGRFRETRIRLPSRFDVHAIDDFERRLQSIDTLTVDRLVIDACEVVHLDATGVRTVRELSSRARLHHMALAIESSAAVEVAFDLLFGESPDLGIHAHDLEAA